ncbi:hypothetical protein [Paenibacillus agaridevorans]|uniref:hypothetical protein n=1 Tax=Paenibacillus agaridevorans TaxID=171404 RepID=UPI001BE41772|nr:hypothetical protein [Paenibacillus agaridevorans]
MIKVLIEEADGERHLFEFEGVMGAFESGAATQEYRGIEVICFGNLTDSQSLSMIEAQMTAMFGKLVAQGIRVEKVTELMAMLAGKAIESALTQTERHRRVKGDQS